MLDWDSEYEQFFRKWDNDGSKDSTEELKRFVLRLVFDGVEYQQVGIARYRIGSVVVHVRHTWACTGVKWPFNINSNTLRADYELWICGMPSLWYLLPIDKIRDMHEAPTAYKDYSHNGITIVTVNEDNDSCAYSRCEPLDISQFRNKILIASYGLA